ncbi:MAG TPA: hypothetical protein VGS41_07060, partial [Chthonomonadales bacterium]|nr:hypothetical protein [Chthonomonadales bacterium]
MHRSFLWLSLSLAAIKIGLSGLLVVPVFKGVPGLRSKREGTPWIGAYRSVEDFASNSPKAADATTMSRRH